MNGPDTDGFKVAMNNELGTLPDMKSWIIVKQRPGMNVLGSIWAFKIKCYPIGTINKLKAHLCVLYDQQIDGLDVFDTYAPVVSFSTVHLLVVMSICLG
eukprot:12894155-Ditylum_brightwellii.AAC.1